MRSSDPLVIGKVIGEVVDSFFPTAKMSVIYNSNNHVYNGHHLLPSTLTSKPKVLLHSAGDFRTFFTLVNIYIRTLSLSLSLPVKLIQFLNSTAAVSEIGQKFKNPNLQGLGAIFCMVNMFEIYCIVGLFLLLVSDHDRP